MRLEWTCGFSGLLGRDGPTTLHAFEDRGVAGVGCETAALLAAGEESEAQCQQDGNENREFSGHGIPR